MENEMICILDFGGKQAYYTARKLRVGQFYCEIFPAETGISDILASSPKGVILCGDDNDAAELPFDPEILGIPVLAFGGAARIMARRIAAEYTENTLTNDRSYMRFDSCDLFEDMSESERFFDRIDSFVLPDGYSSLAFTPTDMIPVFGNTQKHIYGLQFCIESNDPDGLHILENFVGTICACKRIWNVDHMLKSLIDEARDTIGNSRVLLPVSGGINSAVAAAVLSKAIGNRLTCIYIDSGLLRKGDSEFIQNMLAQRMGLQLVTIDAGERFLKMLQGICRPEDKRRVLYEEFTTILAEEYIRLGNIDFIAEGTTYREVLAGRHNFSRKMIEGCRQYEPLQKLFKEDVRILAERLSLPEEILSRPSFASSGMSVRCLGEVTADKLHLLSEADAIFREEVQNYGLDKKIAQYFAILTDRRTPGLHGDGYVCVLRALTTSNAGKASAYKLPYDLMDAVVQRITSELPDINHVVYDITGRPIANVEWE